MGLRNYALIIVKLILNQHIIDFFIFLENTKIKSKKSEYLIELFNQINIHLLFFPLIFHLKVFVFLYMKKKEIYLYHL